MARNEEDAPQGRALVFRDPPPWRDPIDTGDLLLELDRAFLRFLALPRFGEVALSLWALHAHSIGVAEVSPFLAFTSPVKRCGKTTALSVLQRLTPRALLASNVSPAALFRTIEKFGPTLLIDEADTFLPGNEDLRGVLNSGHTRRSANVIRTVGDKHDPRVFQTFGAKAVALIGRLPGTLADRAIVVQMRRRAPHERLERLRTDKDHGFEDLLSKALRWVIDNSSGLIDSDPQMPCQLDDRAADNWRPLVAIADMAGGSWPARAREAALTLSGSEREVDDVALVQLMADIRALLAVRGGGPISSADLVVALLGRVDRPWAEWKQGRPLTQVQLARLLKPLGIGPDSVRFGDETRKGYWPEQFKDAFDRYLPPEAEQTEQPALGAVDGAKADAERSPCVPTEGNADDPRMPRDVPAVPVAATPENLEEPDVPPEMQLSLDLAAHAACASASRQDLDWAHLEEMLSEHGWEPVPDTEDGYGHA